MPAEWGKLRRLERIAEVGEYRLPEPAPRTTTRSGASTVFERMLAGLDVRMDTPVREVRGDAGPGPWS